jgi:hypothetical protein
MRSRGRRKSQGGNSILEFAVVMSFLLPMFAGAFSLGMTIARGIEVSNVCRDAAVLMVRSVFDPQSKLDLSQVQNQKLLMHGAAGLQMTTDNQGTPDPNGKGVVILSKIILVSDAECSAGIVPAPTGAPPWNASNCPNYGSYVFGYRVVIGNGGRWTSTLGTPPSAIIQSGGTISALNIASNTANRAQRFGAGGIMTLNPSTYALVSEMYADVSSLNIFSIFPTPILYSRTIS